ncbi:Uncharacterised protein [Legionella pneumophila]|nr:Uncharacterised protein [Legionella pneumophila]CZG31813.1 Uncharacterised protein [Legionella pneumophila]CZG45224.1 Uncharacterised protein [Legionella pneumophila]
MDFQRTLQPLAGRDAGAARTRGAGAVRASGHACEGAAGRGAGRSRIHAPGIPVDAGAVMALLPDGHRWHGTGRRVPWCTGSSDRPDRTGGAPDRRAHPGGPLAVGHRHRGRTRLRRRRGLLDHPASRRRRLCLVDAQAWQARPPGRCRRGGAGRRDGALGAARTAAGGGGRPGRGFAAAHLRRRVEGGPAHLRRCLHGDPVHPQ